MSKTIKKEIGVVGVDSGQLLVCDPCYLSDWDNTESNDPDPKKFNYDNVCRITLKAPDYAGQINHDLGHPGRAVAFASGFGDGVYPVIAHFKDYGEKGQPDMRIKKVEILMIED